MIMKEIVFPILLGCIMQTSLAAQTAAQPAGRAARPPAPTVAATVVARTPSSRTWARVTSKTNTTGQLVVTTNIAYKELGAGLCYTNNGRLVDAVAEIGIDAVAGGASATRTAHRVHFPATTSGKIHLTLPDGKILDSKVYGLALWDTASGQSILLAPLAQNCPGTLVGTNRVIYTNAFHAPSASNGVVADLEYVLTRSGLEQNIILRSPIPSPESLGLSPASTKLEALSEFFSPSAPTKRTRASAGIADDVSLRWRSMAMGAGKAFYIPGQANQRAAELGHVAKHWGKIGTRDFLVEEVPYTAISNAVQSLPPHAAGGAMGEAVRHFAALEPLLPQEADLTGPPKAMQIAQSLPEKPGVLLDYTVLDCSDFGSDPFVFDGGTTYYVSSGLYFDTAPTFSGGTVVKFDSGWGGPLENGGDWPFNFNGSPASPVYFTSSDDDSVGETIEGSSGNPVQTQDTYLLEDCDAGPPGSNGGSTLMSYARFAYAGTAYANYNDWGHTITDSQFTSCDTPLVLANDAFVCLQNDLFAYCSNCVVTTGSGVYQVQAQNITADSNGGLINCGLCGCQVNIVNSILMEYDYFQYQYTLDHTSTNTVAWQAGPLGDHYLPPDSAVVQPPYIPLINGGNTTADQLGLYHYTTQTNQVVDGTTIVDLGYHYLALGANGLPLDSNGDGIPDYLEDANGNGLYDDGDLGNWLPNINDTGAGLSLQVYTPMQ